MSVVPAAPRRGARSVNALITARLVVAACALGTAVALSSADDWQPLTLVAAFAVATVIGELASVRVGRIRISSGLMVQTVIMAVLGPGPAAVVGAGAIAVESRVNRVPARFVANNVMVVGLLGLVGGLLFDALRAVFDLDPEDSRYAVLVLPTYVALAALNLTLVAVAQIRWTWRDRLRVLTETGIPAAPLELVNGMFAMAAVLVWAEAGLAAAAALIIVLAVTMPLAQTLGDALLSDERAVEVSRLATDRERLLSEVMDAESRERARLAESLHDGPMQRLVAVRQDAAEREPGLVEDLDAAIRETRALISAFHPATVLELGFERSLRAAVVPFPAARGVELTIDCAADDRVLAGTLLLPVGQELVVNAVKHAEPTTIEVRVHREGSDVILEVTDDGLGIDEAQATGRAVQAGHVGLAMVRRRVEDAGGRLDIATRPDGGTRSRVVIAASAAFGTPP